MSIVLSNKENYHIANKLQISESKVKALRLNAALKYKQANHKAVLANIVTKVINEMIKPDFTEGFVAITVENPVELRELEYVIKTTGRSIEYGFNREILKISPVALFELVVSNCDNPEQEFKKIIQDKISDESKKSKIFNDALTFRQKFNKVKDEVKDKASVIGLLSSAGAAIF